MVKMEAGHNLYSIKLYHQTKSSPSKPKLYQPDSIILWLVLLTISSRKINDNLIVPTIQFVI
jgi:hypothetical protein